MLDLQTLHFAQSVHGTLIINAAYSFAGSVILHHVIIVIIIIVLHVTLSVSLHLL